MLIVTLVLTGGCQKTEQSVPPPAARSEQQLDTEYRAILAEVGLYKEGAVPAPAQIDPGHYGQVLCSAAGHASTEMLVRLLDARPDVNLNERIDGRTILHCAAASQHSTNSNLLLERGLDPNIQDNHGRTALHLATPQKDGVNLARLLLSRGARPDAKDENGVTPLMHSQPEAIKLLVDRGADLSAQDANGNTALHWAVQHKAVDAAALLLYLGAAPASQNSAGKTPLLHAVENRDVVMAELLLRAGSNPDTPDISGLTPRLAAEKSGNKLLMGKFAASETNDKGSAAQ
jgi:ankyrin repeat protein